MLPLINGKRFLSCSEADLQVLLDNSDFRENEYLDYKSTFSFLEMSKGKERDAKRRSLKVMSVLLQMQMEAILFSEFQIKMVALQP